MLYLIGKRVIWRKLLDNVLIERFLCIHHHWRNSAPRLEQAKMADGSFLAFSTELQASETAPEVHQEQRLSALQASAVLFCSQSD